MLFLSSVGAIALLFQAPVSPGPSNVADCCRCGSSLAAYAQQVASSPASDSQLGGDIVPTRQVFDPFPVFNGIAIDSQSNILVMSDVNRKSLLTYDRSASPTKPSEPTPSLTQIIGPETNLGFVTGVAVDPQRREIFTVNNDIEDTLVVMPYTAAGNQKPTRLLSVPHQAWGLALSLAHNEIAVSVEMHNAVVFYRRIAQGVETPVHYIRGPDTKLADPHGLFWDERHNEIGVVNHGNFRGMVKNTGGGCVPTGTADQEGGALQPPSISIYPADATGNQKPLRVIQGEATKLDFPMGLAVDSVHGEIAAANNGGDSVLIFDRATSGNVAPIRVIGGPRTGISRPMGVVVDTKNDEIWVSNFGDHTALAFARTASGNVAPKRVIRTAPAGTPTAGFGNPMAVAYDSKRKQILVPN